MNQARHFRIEPSGDTLVFCAIGNIGGLVEDEAREEWDVLLEQLDEHNAIHAVIDLGSLEYFGSIMLELMVLLWKQVSLRQGKLAICNASEVGLEILHTAKFDSIWKILPTREEAIEAVHG